MVAIIDYGVGNLFSLKCSLAAIGAESVVTGDADTILKADRVILPGVGAFADAYAKLCAAGMDRAVYAAADAGKPLLGICLGMQLLFERSYEYGEHRGLGLLKGEVIGMEGTLPAGLYLAERYVIGRVVEVDGEGIGYVPRSQAVDLIEAVNAVVLG